MNDASSGIPQSYKDVINLKGKVFNTCTYQFQNFLIWFKLSLNCFDHSKTSNHIFIFANHVFDPLHDPRLSKFYRVKGLTYPAVWQMI